jgi:peptidoglycan hydrolase CwlO-like protein
VDVGSDNAATPPSVIRRPTSSPPTDHTIGSILNETMDLFSERMSNAQRENRLETELFQEKARRDTELSQEKARINSRISHLTDMVRATKREKFRSTNEEEKQFLQEEIVSMEQEIDSLKESLRELGRN